MSQHPFDKLALNNGATAIFTPCPGTKDTDLASSVQQLSAAGANAIITLMYDEEIATNNAQALPELCKQHNMAWFQLPISDDAAPNDDFLQAYKTNLASMLDILNNKGQVAVHCKGGSGRTGLVIGLLMLELGYSKEEVIELVQSVRPKSLKNEQQLNYFLSFKD